MLFYQSWHEMNQDLTPVMLPILTWEKTWVQSSIKKLGDCDCECKKMFQQLKTEKISL